MKIIQAIRTEGLDSIAFVGAGGKSTTIFELAGQVNVPVFITTTTKISVDEKELGDRWIEINSVDDLNSVDFRDLDGITVFTGSQLDENHMGELSPELVERLYQEALEFGAILLIEADGAKKKPLKAPLEHEPLIPEFVDLVVVSAGLSGLGMKLSKESVHRPERFSKLSGLSIGEKIKFDSLVQILVHEEGSLKGIPSGKKGILHLTQVNSEEVIQAVRKCSDILLGKYSKIILSDLDDKNKIQVKVVIQKTAGIILAAGGASRAGQPKQLLDWFGEPIIRKVVKTALESNLTEVVVVTGETHQQIEEAISDLNVKVVKNLDWQSGISSSVRVGMNTVSDDIGAAMFLLADQPQIPVRLLNSIIDDFEINQTSITCPVVDGKRGNPVLFDVSTFPDLIRLEGDKGGKQLFSKYEVRGVVEFDIRMKYDIDTIKDYRDLIIECKKG